MILIDKRNNEKVCDIITNYKASVKDVLVTIGRETENADNFELIENEVE